MIFSQENAGKWVASKNGKEVDSASKLSTLLKRVEQRSDKSNISFDKVPKGNFVGSVHGV